MDTILPFLEWSARVDDFTGLLDRYEMLSPRCTGVELQVWHIIDIIKYCFSKTLIRPPAAVPLFPRFQNLAPKFELCFHMKLRE